MPLVSVVMSVYNDADNLPRTIQGILDQSFQDFEFIIINDGSTDDSADILVEYSENSKIKIFPRSNVGLTRSLIFGCQQASGTYIARQDVGDYSFPSRLQQQTEYLEGHGQHNAVTSWVRHVAPENELLDITRHTEAELAQALINENVSKLHGPPHHGAVMFRTSDYHQVGGYREQFYFAQDLDLWTRLIETGQHGIIPEPLYDVGVYPKGISWIHSEKQNRLKALIAQAVSMRKTGSDHEVLDKARMIVPDKIAVNPNASLAQGYYFIGSQLLKSDAKNARKYLFKSIGLNKLSVRSYYKYFKTFV